MVVNYYQQAPIQVVEQFKSKGGCDGHVMMIKLFIWKRRKRKIKSSRQR
jgi:hypothetical protein